MIIEFLKELTDAGYRLFSTADAKEIGFSLGLQDRSVFYILHQLKEKKMIRPLVRGHYVIEDNILSGSPLDKLEIGMYLVPKGAVCCWSAMSHYGLTDQVLSKIYLFLPYAKTPRKSVKAYRVDGYEYSFIQIQHNNFWGIKEERIGETKIVITDLERTLLDGLIRPQYCGGFREVMSAFDLARSQIDQAKLFSYAKRSTMAVQKRLGWLLEKIDFDGKNNFSIPHTSYMDKLDTAAPRRGKHNTKWMVFENF